MSLWICSTLGSSLMFGGTLLSDGKDIGAYTSSGSRTSERMLLKCRRDFE
jgi:hypothetical protein